MITELQPPLSDEFSISGFKAYLMTTAGGSRSETTAHSITNDLVQFYNITLQSSRDAFARIDKLLNKVNLIHFIRAETSDGPTATAGKLLMLKLAIQFIINLTNRKDYYIMGCSLLDFLAKEVSKNVSS